MENNSSIKSLMKLIQRVCDENLSRQDSITSGVIDFVNSDGTVDLHIPPDNVRFTNISNQCPFELNPGDTVKLIKEKGRASNMWVIAKCGVTNQGTQSILDLAHPVGSYYWSENSENPGSVVGGIWERVENHAIDNAYCWKRTK